MILWPPTRDHLNREMTNSSASMPIIGLTGGIGSGKSTVSDKLANAGACIIDSDLVARKVVEPGSEGLEMVVKRFGSSVLAGDGSLDRPKLAGTVFADPDSLADLNSILHPLIEKEIKAQVVNCFTQRKFPVIVVLPLLFETNAVERYGFTKVIVVDLPEELAVARVVSSRDMTEEEVRSRISSQISREQRISGADYVIDNSVDNVTLDRKVAELWSELKALY